MDITQNNWTVIAVTECDRKNALLPVTRVNMKVIT